MYYSLKNEQVKINDMISFKAEVKMTDNKKRHSVLYMDAQNEGFNKRKK